MQKGQRGRPRDIRINLRFGAASEKWLVEELARRRPYRRAKYLRELIRLGSLAKRGKLPLLAAALGAAHGCAANLKEHPAPPATALDESVLGEIGELIRF